MDRSEGWSLGPRAPETSPSQREAVRCEQAKRDNEAVQGYVTFFPVHLAKRHVPEAPGV